MDDPYGCVCRVSVKTLYFLWAVYLFGTYKVIWKKNHLPHLIFPRNSLSWWKIMNIASICIALGWIQVGGNPPSFVILYFSAHVTASKSLIHFQWQQQGAEECVGGKKWNCTRDTMAFSARFVSSTTQRTRQASGTWWHTGRWGAGGQIYEQGPSFPLLPLSSTPQHLPLTGSTGIPLLTPSYDLQLSQEVKMSLQCWNQTNLSSNHGCVHSFCDI